jgi:hypothetical protein
MINDKDYNLRNSDRFKKNQTVALDFYEDYISAITRDICLTVDKLLDNVPEEASARFKDLFLHWARLNRLQREQLMKLFNGPFEELRRRDPNYHHYDATGRDMIRR